MSVMAAPLLLLLITGGARLSYIEATTVTSPHLRGRDSYNSLSTTNNTFQNTEVSVDVRSTDTEVWSTDTEWSQQRSSSLNTAASSCGEGDSFTISSQKDGDLNGCYIKTWQYNGEPIYTFENRRGRKYMVAAINSNETNASPDVHWTLTRIDKLHRDIICISAASTNHTHPVDASWACNFSPSGMFLSPRGMVPIAASSNDIVFSCGCPTTVKPDSLNKTVYHRRTVNNDANVLYGIAISCYLVAIIGRIFILVCRPATPSQIVLVRVPTRRAGGEQNSSSAGTARNTHGAAATSSNEPASEMEMMRLLRRPGGAANNLGDIPEEGEGTSAILQ